MKDKLLKDFENLKIENANEVKGGGRADTSKKTNQCVNTHGHIHWEDDHVPDPDLFSASTDPGVLPI